MNTPYDPRFGQSLPPAAEQFRNQLNYISGGMRKLDQMSQQVDDLQSVVNALSATRSGAGDSDLIRIANVPGRRVPYVMLVDIPIGANERTKQQGSFTVSQEGPFIAVRRMATFQSSYQVQTTDPETGATAEFAGRSFGRYRPIHSAWDIMDSQHFSNLETGFWFLWLLQTGVPPGNLLPSAGLGMPNNMSSFRTMEFDARIEILNAGSSYPRQKISVPSSMWTPQINAPQDLGCLDFMDKGEVYTFEVQPTHVNNPAAGNVNGAAVFGTSISGGAIGAAAGWPFIEGQYDAHEGIATPGAAQIAVVDETRLPQLLETDTVERLPEGILTLGFEGYKIVQPVAPVG